MVCHMQEVHKTAALNRLKTVRGHLDAVIGMVENERYCPEVMKQVRQSLTSNCPISGEPMLREAMVICDACRQAVGPQSISGGVCKACRTHP